MNQKIENSFKESIKVKKEILDTNLYFSISKMSEIASKKLKMVEKYFFVATEDLRQMHNILQLN